MFQIVKDFKKSGKRIWCNDRGLGYWGDPALDAHDIQYMSQERAEKAAMQLHGKAEPKP